MRPIINIHNSIIILSNPWLFHLTLNLILNCLVQNTLLFPGCVSEQVVATLVIIINTSRARSRLMRWDKMMSMSVQYRYAVVLSCVILL